METLDTIGSWFQTLFTDPAAHNWDMFKAIPFEDLFTWFKDGLSYFLRIVFQIG